MGVYYHFTTLDKLDGILNSRGISPHSTHCNYEEVEFISLSKNGNMILGINDGRYNNHNVRIDVEINDEFVIDIEYSLKFFREHPEIAAYVFTDMNDDMDYLFDDGYSERIEKFIKSLKYEQEVLVEYYIELKHLKKVTLINNSSIRYVSYDVGETMNSVIKKLEEMGIEYEIGYDWEDVRVM